MTDKEILLCMFTERKIEFREVDNCIVIEAGYAGFATYFRFDVDDKLLSVEAYE